jgi:YHS domain-containing protein
MLKKLLIIISFAVFLSSFIFAQENPVNENQETQLDTIVNNEQLVDTTASEPELEIWNKVCPVMGNKVDVDGPTVEYNGKLYGFCCPGCDAKFEKNPEKYSKNLSEDGTKFIGRK